MSHFTVTILKSGPSLDLPRFQSRPAFILLISTSGLIRMETMLHLEMGPELQPHRGLTETSWWEVGGRKPSAVELIGFCVTEWRGECSIDPYFLLCEGYLRLMLFKVGSSSSLV